MRNVLSECLAEYSLKDPNFILITGDHGYALFDRIRQVSPEKFLNLGIMEQMVISGAAGMAKVGLHPFCYGLSSFIILRAFEQIKFDVVLPKLPVKIIGDGAGLVYTSLGNSHQCAEDIALMNSLPQIEIFSPGDDKEMAICFSEFSNCKGPAYLRVGKADLGNYHAVDLDSTFPVFVKKYLNSKNLILSTGSMIKIANSLANDFNFDQISFSKISPLYRNDSEKKQILEILLKYNHIFTIEEHVTSGGFSTIIQSFLMDAKKNKGDSIKVTSFGLKSSFTTTAGGYQHALSQHELTLDNIKNKIKEEIKL